MDHRTTYVDPAGRVWHRFALDWTSAYGEFSTQLWALSRDHAEMMLAELKETGRIGGQVVGIVDAGSP